MAHALTLTCLHPGGGTFVVDGGRPHRRALGVVRGGPADPRARAAANDLLGQAADHPCLETTLTGGRWLLSGRGQLALTGSDMSWRLNGRVLETYTVVDVAGDGLLVSQPARRGLRSYLAVAGDWQLPRALGSAEAGWPGVPPVAPGWSVTVLAPRPVPYRTDLDVDRHLPPAPFVLPVGPGPEWSWLTPAQRDALLANVYRVSTASNRQGVRLTAPAAPPPELPSLISSPVLPGTVQLTPAGPVVLGPAAHTIGGYPRVLLVDGADALAACFQVALGGTVRLALRG